MARARRIAEWVHRGRLFGGHGLFVDHLARVAAAVGDGAAGQAAWLYATPRARWTGLPPRVVRILEQLQPGPHEYPRAFTERLLRDRAAARVRWAVLNDLHSTGRRDYEWWREQHATLAAALGLPGPGPGPSVRPPALRDLLASYRTSGRSTTVLSALYAAAAEPAPGDEADARQLSEDWWDSPDDWECLVAVTARAALATDSDRPALLTKVDSRRPHVTEAAIQGLRGPADDHEIALLERVIADPEPTLRWAQRAAVTRLKAIGDPRAEAALRSRVLNPVDPPWRDDPAWLDDHGRDAIPVLIANLGDTAWWHEGPFALGELRAEAAVPALCRLGGSVPAIEALGKIGSAGAVPTLLELTGHRAHEVRDHALRALARIGDPRVVEAAMVAGDDPHPVVRDRAARVLARHGDRRAVTALTRLCDTGHAARAAAALARIGDPRALPTLWHLFGATGDQRVRNAAGRGIAAISGRREFPARLHGDVHLRRAYTWLLGRKPEWQALPTLRRMLADDDPGVRAHAVRALARLGDRESGRPLANDPDPRVRAAADHIGQ